jgi:hypothetical protein
MTHRWTAMAALSLPAVFLSCQGSPDISSKARIHSGPDGQADWARQFLSEMDAAVTASPELAEINAREELVAEIDQTLLKAWREAWLGLDGAAYAALLVKPASDLAWDTGIHDPRRSRRGITENAWSPKAATGVGHSARYLAGFKEIIDLRLMVTKVRKTSDGAVLELRMDLRGLTTVGHRRHDRGSILLGATKTPSGWMIEHIEALSLERLVAQRAPAYVDASKSWGLDQIPVTDRREAIRRGGYALSVVDFNGDDRPDLLFGDYGPVQLLKNTGSGFEEVDVGLGSEDSVKSAAIVDLDNDGDRDLLLLRFAFNDGPLGDMVAYRNDGGNFVRVSQPLPRRHNYDRAMPLTLADFDLDGNIDIYIGFPGTMDFTNNLEVAKRPDTLASQGVWFNQGGWNFKEVDASHPIIRENHVYSHGAVATDIDLDGKVDIVVIDDSGRVNPVYRNQGAGRFSEVSKKAGLQAPGWSMGLSTGDFDADGDLDILTTNIALSAGRRILDSIKGKTGIEKLDTLRLEYVGARLYRNNGDQTFTEVSEQAGLGWVGDAAAGAEFIDYDHDGLLDIYVSNGLWSAGEKKLDSLFIRGVTGVYADSDPHQADVHGGQPVFGKMGPAYATGDAPTPNPMLTALRNHIDPVTAAPTWSLAGHQRNRLFRNNGDGSFTEVGFLEGADRIEDGYVIAPADIDGDGRQDLVLRNCDPAPGVNLATVKLLRNQLSDVHSLSVKLTGTKSNREAFGAVVSATVDGRRQIREIRGTNGAVQGEPVAFFGLGSRSEVERLEIRWPSGEVQVFEDVAQGRVRLTEGSDTLVR